ncbi:hypothetical protein BDV25DRAFT_156227 [Aspergillus avenaceus]|uniref:Zn(2)-C6 fungal-type domain-containing protein n=1 Tax=Aspergillus avenaceus TaxID=36643 RepID=A0A5N6TSZ6_ASPAV|nr:hypothetical protein BDV25DRAFT_156227 [Aspergillus avenaceus]
MVGIPRSKGCRLCVNRKVKCDETRPHCRRCTKGGFQCPGYTRPLKFCDETLTLKRKYNGDNASKPYCGRIRKTKRVRSVASQESSIDGTLAPNLAYEALHIQMKERFNDFLNMHSASVYGAVSGWIDTNWLDYVRDQASTCGPAMLWALRAMTTFNMGLAKEDREAIICGQHMYGRAIEHLSQLLQSSSALSDETLAAAMVLAGFDQLDSDCPKSWLMHTCGIRDMICARGPEAHRHGIGRTLLVSWRPFLVLESMVHEKPCFLEDPTWAAVARGHTSEGEQGVSRALGQIIDYALIEIAKYPGYAVRTQRIIEPGTTPNPDMIRDLVADIDVTKAYLLRLLPNFSFMSVNTGPLTSVYGLIPQEHANFVVRRALDGINTEIALLNDLLTTLHRHVEDCLRAGHNDHELISRYMCLLESFKDHTISVHKKVPKTPIYHSHSKDGLIRLSKALGLPCIARAFL